MVALNLAEKIDIMLSDRYRLHNYSSICAIYKLLEGTVVTVIVW
jgi:hypothetical protein